jgi:hypothetical protein
MPAEREKGDGCASHDELVELESKRTIGTISWCGVLADWWVSRGKRRVV